MKLLEYSFISVYLIILISCSPSGDDEKPKDDKTPTNDNSKKQDSQSSGDNSGNTSQRGKAKQEEDTSEFSFPQAQVQTSDILPSVSTSRTGGFPLIFGKGLPPVWAPIGSGQTGKMIFSKELPPLSKSTSIEKKEGGLKISDEPTQRMTSEKRPVPKIVLKSSTNTGTDVRQDPRLSDTGKSAGTDGGGYSLTRDSHSSTSGSIIGRDSRAVGSSSSHPPNFGVLTLLPPSTSVAPAPSTPPPTSLDQVASEGLLLAFRAQRRMVSVPERFAGGIPCAVPPWNRPIEHSLLTMKNIRIPIQMGTYQVRPVKFVYHPDVETTRFVMLECACEIFTRGFGFEFLMTSYHFSMLTPPESVCVDGKIHLLRGVMGPSSFFVFSYNDIERVFNVLAHIRVTQEPSSASVNISSHQTSSSQEQGGSSNEI